MRDLLESELTHVYGAGGKGKKARRKKKRKAKRGSNSGSRSGASHSASSGS